jgi:hypothetical protein
MKKIIFALQGNRNSGKSIAINLLFKKLDSIGFSIILKPHKKNSKDFRAIIEMKGKRIGITNRGDFPKNIIEDLLLFVQNKCKIIVCACHIDDSTVQAVCSCNYVKKFIPKHLAIEKKDEDRINEYDADALLCEIIRIIVVKKTIRGEKNG